MTFAMAIVFAAFAGLAAPAARGAPGDKTDIRIELPALVGGYHIGDNTPSQDPTSRSTTFALPDSVAGIWSMRLVIAATWNMGFAEIIRFPNATPDTLPWIVPLQMEISAPELGECYAFSYVGGQEGFWIDSGYFTSECLSGQLGLKDLLGLDLNVELYCRFGERADTRLVEDAYGTVYSVSLELLSAVQIESATWGAVKALYR